jgi:hypothetical protein
MYLIQRKSDGKFFSNKAGHYILYPEGYNHLIKSNERFWVENKNDCIPFRSIKGAKQSKCWVDRKAVYRDAVRGECVFCDRNDPRDPCDKKNYTHIKYEKMEEDELPYIVIQVVIRGKSK